MNNDLRKVVIVVTSTVGIMTSGALLTMTFSDQMALGAETVFPRGLLHALLDHKRLAQQQYRDGKQR